VLNYASTAKEGAMSGSDRAFRLIVETLSQLERERVGPLDAVPPMVDIAVSLALAAEG